MWSEREIQDAARQWRAVADGIADGLFEGEPGEEYQKGLSQGYASALEMVLREARS